MQPQHETTASHIETPDGPLRIPAHIKRRIDHVMNADRVYFRAHPGVTQRDRRYIPGEAWPAEPDADRVTVIRLSSGQQARCYYRAGGDDR